LPLKDDLKPRYFTGKVIRDRISMTEKANVALNYIYATDYHLKYNYTR